MIFLLYIIKDVMDYAGFSGNPSKFGARIAARELKMALAKFELLTQKSQYLSKVQSVLEQ